MDDWLNTIFSGFAGGFVGASGAFVASWILVRRQAKSDSESLRATAARIPLALFTELSRKTADALASKSHAAHANIQAEIVAGFGIQHALVFPLGAELDSQVEELLKAVTGADRGTGANSTINGKGFEVVRDNLRKLEKVTETCLMKIQDIVEELSGIAATGRTNRK